MNGKIQSNSRFVGRQLSGVPIENCIQSSSAYNVRNIHLSCMQQKSLFPSVHNMGSPHRTNKEILTQDRSQDMDRKTAKRNQNTGRISLKGIISSALHDFAFYYSIIFILLIPFIVRGTA